VLFGAVVISGVSSGVDGCHGAMCSSTNILVPEDVVPGY
jgi:hypothetical protein